MIVSETLKNENSSRRAIKTITPPPIDIFHKSKRKENCLRHVKQLMVRGEQIVSIQVVQPEDLEKIMNLFNVNKPKKP